MCEGLLRKHRVGAQEESGGSLEKNGEGPELHLPGTCPRPAFLI